MTKKKMKFKNRQDVAIIYKNKPINKGSVLFVRRGIVEVIFRGPSNFHRYYHESDGEVINGPPDERIVPLTVVHKRQITIAEKKKQEKWLKESLKEINKALRSPSDGLLLDILTCIDREKEDRESDF